MSAAAVIDRPASPPAPSPRRRLRRLAQFLGAVAAALVLVALAICGLYWHWSRAALPQIDGEAKLTGLSAPVTIRRDALGVPHLSAASVLDAGPGQARSSARRASTPTAWRR